MINTLFTYSNPINKLKAVNVKQHPFTISNLFIKENIVISQE